MVATPRRTTDDDGDVVDLEANCDDDEVFLTTAKIIANDNGFSENEEANGGGNGE